MQCVRIQSFESETFIRIVNSLSEARVSKIQIVPGCYRSGRLKWTHCSSWLFPWLCPNQSAADPRDDDIVSAVDAECAVNTDVWVSIPPAARTSSRKCAIVVHAAGLCGAGWTMQEQQTVCWTYQQLSAFLRSPAILFNTGNRVRLAFSDARNTVTVLRVLILLVLLDVVRLELGETA